MSEARQALADSVERSFASTWTTEAVVAAENGHQDAAAALLAAGSPLEAFDSQGWTAANIAASAGLVRVLRMLLDAGARATTRVRSSGRTPLMGACQHGHVACVRVLLQHARGGGGGAGVAFAFGNNSRRS